MRQVTDVTAPEHVAGFGVVVDGLVFLFLIVAPLPITAYLVSGALGYAVDARQVFMVLAGVLGVALGLVAIGIFLVHRHRVQRTRGAS